MRVCVWVSRFTRVCCFFEPYSTHTKSSLEAFVGARARVCVRVRVRVRVHRCARARVAYGTLGRTHSETSTSSSVERVCVLLTEL